MRIAEIWRYPVKSMGGERLEEAVIGPLGIPGDREWVVVDGAGRIQDARSRPGLLRHRATLGPDGRARIDGRDWEDAEVGRWIRAAAGPEARLSRVTGAERFDVLPLLVVTDGAIAALGVDHRRLRPNLVVEGVAGLAERGWEGRHLAVEDAVIALANLRDRCIMTTWDPDTGAQDLEVLLRIRRDFGGTFALNAWAARPRGDPRWRSGFAARRVRPARRAAVRALRAALVTHEGARGPDESVNTSLFTRRIIHAGRGRAALTALPLQPSIG